MSTTNSALTDTERLVYGCPAWCERTDHDADRTDPGDMIMHYGPDFGQFWLQGSGFGDEVRPVARVSEDVAEAQLSADDLRKLAADATAAADWLEQHAAAQS